MKKKKITKIIIVVIFMLFFIMLNIKDINAKNKVNVYFVYNNVKVNSKDNLIININLSNFDEVKEIKLRIDKPNNLEPLVSNNGYFDINSNTDFSNILVNEYILNESLNLDIIKQDLNSTSYHNNICSISFIATETIENVIEQFENNVKIYLFDKELHLLNYEITHTEKLKAEWEIENNILEVYSEIPSFIDFFNVKNRNIDEYELIFNQNVDTSVIGLQAISIIVIDKLNNDYLVFNQAVSIVDSSKPALSYPEKIEVLDTEINNLFIEKYVSASDNYDLLPVIHISYFDNENNSIKNIDEFKKYIKIKKEGYIEVYATDSSSNESEKVLLKFNVIDTTPPNIVLNFDDNIYVDDFKIDEFNIFDYFVVIDNYDYSPNIIFNFSFNMTNISIDNVIFELKKGNDILCEYYAIDNEDNKTQMNSCMISVKDLTPPIINGVEDLIIKDVEIDNINFSEKITCTDNIDQTPSIIIKYYIDDIEYNKYEFLSYIKKGYSGYINYTAIDKSLNISNEYIQQITVIDTLSPIINILDIKDNGKYIKLDEIKYEITDNFDQDIEIYVTLNDYEYAGTKISEIGTYNFKIIAIDKAGNESIKELNFNIIEKNITGCANDIDCYMDNYTSVIVVVTVLMIVSLSIIIYKIIHIIKNKKNSKNKLSINIDSHE